ncbi:MAG: 6,7-dimethyl-8-ribityllumazine synthase [Deltaproteobacteria bacterium]|nr:6,7-dimethyl-8-ribityllumazine synthase [Deltaproteobacteria bacterium]
MARPKTAAPAVVANRSPREIEGQLVVPAGARFALVVSRFNHFIVDRLVEGALDALRRHGGDMGEVTIVRVPGAWEMPLAASAIVRAKSADAVIGLGCVIRGSTPHFDYVAAEVTKGLAHLSLDTGVPVVLGVLTTDTIEQAIERAGTKAGNKGWDSAVSAIEMVSLLRGLRG